MAGALGEAVETYRRLIDAFPALPEAARAMISAADCLVAQGEEHVGEAEELLRQLLAGRHFGPRRGRVP